MLDLLIRTLNFAVPVLITIFLGLFFGGILMETGMLSRISSISRPLVSIAHLPEICATSFVVSIGSTVAANGMIARFREDELLEDREVFLCAMTNSIPAYVREIFTYQIPIVVPALGIAAGGMYAFIFMITALVKVILVIVLGRLLFEERSYGVQSYSRSGSVSIRRATAKVLRGQAKMFGRISLVYILMTLMVFALKDQGFFEVLSVLPLADLFGIPPESIVPLTSYVASPILGLSMLGPMIHSGSISDIQALVVLMLGSMFMLPVFAIRSMVPNYTALFGPRTGLTVVAISTGISMFVRLAFLLVFLMAM